MSTQPRRPFFRRRKTCPFSGPSAPKIDYKDTRLLSRYISERGKIVPVAHHRGVGQEAARARPGDQARPLPGPAALRDPLMRSAPRAFGVGVNEDVGPAARNAAWLGWDRHLDP